MPDTFLSAASRRNILALQRIGERIGKTQYRLATGRKVNTAIDNPASFFTASALRDRAGALNRVVDEIALKLQSIRAADAAIEAVTTLVQSAQSVLGDALLAPAPRPAATGTADLSNVDNLTDLAGVSNGDQFSVQVGDAAPATVTISDADTPQGLLDTLNAIENVSARFTGDGVLEITSANGEDLVLAEVANAPLAGLGIAEGTFDDSTGASARREAAAANFDVLRSQIDQLIGDAVFNGVNLVAGNSLTFLFNETGSSSLTVDGVNSYAAGLGISPARNGFRSDGDINAANAELTGALDGLRTYSARLSSDVAVSQIRSDFSASLRSSLAAGADQLTRADLSEEGAMLLSLQTRHKLASSALSLLHKSESNVLRLLD